jgi:hypothetical protein
LGKAIVVLIGHLTMIFYGVCLSALVNEVTAAIEWVASMMLSVSGKVARVIRQCGGPELVASSEQEARYKLLVAIGLLHGYLGICAACAQTVFGHYLDTEITFDEGYYFGFVTFSTIGFGDFALQPYGAPSSLIFVEALAVFAGLAFFGAFASHGAAWINESPGASPWTRVGCLGSCRTRSARFRLRPLRRHLHPPQPRRSPPPWTTRSTVISCSVSMSRRLCQPNTSTRSRCLRAGTVLCLGSLASRPRSSVCMW